MKVISVIALLGASLAPAHAIRYGPGPQDPTLDLQKELNAIHDDMSDGDGINPEDYHYKPVEFMGEEDRYDEMPWDAEVRLAANDNTFVMRVHPPTKAQMMATTKLSYGHVDGDTCGYHEPCDGDVGGTADARDLMQLDHGCVISAPAQEYLCRDGYVEQKKVTGATVEEVWGSGQMVKQPDYYKDYGATFQIWKSGKTSMNEALSRTKYSTRYGSKYDKTCIMAVAGSDDIKDFSAELNYDPENPDDGRIYNTDTVRNNGLAWGVLGFVIPTLQAVGLDEYVYEVSNLDYTKEGSPGGTSTPRDIHSGFYDYMTEDTNLMDAAGTKMKQNNDCKQWFYTGHSLGGISATLLSMVYGATGQKGAYDDRWDGNYGTVYTTGALSLVFHTDAGDLVGGFRIAHSHDPAANFRTTEANKPDKSGDYKFEHVGGSMIIHKGTGGKYDGGVSWMQHDYHTDKCDGAGHIGSCTPTDHSSTHYCAAGVNYAGLQTGGHAYEAHDSSLAFTCGASGSGFAVDGTEFCPSCCVHGVGAGNIIEQPLNFDDMNPQDFMEGLGSMDFTSPHSALSAGLAGAFGGAGGLAVPPIPGPGYYDDADGIHEGVRMITQCHPADCGDKTDASYC